MDAVVDVMKTKKPNTSLLIDGEWVNDIELADQYEKRLLKRVINKDIKYMGRDKDGKYVPLTKDMRRLV